MTRAHLKNLSFQEQPQVQVQETQQIESVIEQKEEVEERNEVQEQIECQSYVAEVSSQTIVTTTTMTSTTSEEVVTFEELAADATGEPVNETLVEEEAKSEEVSVLSSAFAEQLANVQSQLMALSHLPRTIQSTLDDITKQLQSLIPPSKLKQKSTEPEIRVEEAATTTTETSEGNFQLRFLIKGINNTSRGLSINRDSSARRADVGNDSRIRLKARRGNGRDDDYSRRTKHG